MTIHGKNFIGRSLVASGTESSVASNPVTGMTLEGTFVAATEAELDRAVTLAQSAFKPYRQLSQARRADFLDAIGEEIVALGDDLIQRAMAESGLPEARLIGERGRTVGQLGAFANLLRDGSWCEATIDTADPERQPIPKVDVRRMLVPMGPVVVFAASNFPIAFSVGGGDTASALAGGNPVIVKAHSGHLGTSEFVASAILKAAERTGMPDGVFSMLHGSGRTVGQSLVKHPLVTAVGFTGSERAGRTLFDLASARPRPIPVFAEMGSVNPVLLTPGALAVRGEAIATMYVGSITLGVGQFCTNPGLLIGIAGDDMDAFSTQLGQEISAMAPATMLNATVHQGFLAAYEAALGQSCVTIEGMAAPDAGAQALLARPTVASVSGADFLANPSLHREVFGPYSLVVKCADAAELASVIESLEGQLTATVIAEDDELSAFADVIDMLHQRSGRILFNGVPTGVEVCAAMHHGGPYPAATDPRFSSVGVSAIKRFVRPVAFQSCPETLLPDELKSENPLGIWRLVDGVQTRSALK